MPPFAKFRGHRRTSTPTSPNPSSVTTLDSPYNGSTSFEKPGTPSDSPFEPALPSPRFKLPSFSGPANQSPGHEVTALPSFSQEDLQAPVQTFTLDRPVSSSAAAPKSSGYFSSSFQGPARIRPSPIPNEQYAQSAQAMSERPYMQDTLLDGRTAFVSGLSSERALPDDFEGPRGQSGRVSKGRLNLLNPMSLLARRRSSQATSQRLEDGSLTVNTLPIPAMPDDYDPRIRGKIVHDFSAPRPRRNLSSEVTRQRQNQKEGQHQSETRDQLQIEARQQRNQDERKNSKSPEHAPLFKEHFSDDRPILRPESTGYLHSFAAMSAIPHPEHEAPSVPAFARNLPTRLPESESAYGEKKQATSSEESGSATMSTKTIATKSPPRLRSNPSDLVGKVSALPKHMTSNASRFSFDLGGVDSSAQERLLEEKHKQKEAARKANKDANDYDESEVDEYENYGFDDDDGLEEKIPGVNADAEDDLEEPPSTGARFQQFHFTPPVPSAIMSPATTYDSGRTSFPTPRDEQGQAIGFAMSQESPDLNNIHHSYQNDQNKLETVGLLGGLGISTLPNLPLNAAENFRQADERTPTGFEEEEMYFDDGDIQLGLDDDPSGAFDESIFDGDAGQIRDIPAQNNRNLLIAQQNRLKSPESDSSELNGRFSALLLRSPDQAISQSIQKPGIPRMLDATQAKLEPSPLAHVGLTEGNMAAYQEALVSAANEAAASGRFTRATSISQTSDERASESQLADSHPGLVSDDSRLSQMVEPLPPVEAVEHFVFNDDEDLDDDLMIAEANAEALENDDEGFYGREFGFYAKAHGKGSAEMINGGFFDPRGVEGINRSHSGRANFQEPSLTPITERSEWSARNSMASLQTFGLPQSAHSLPSPAIAQLLDQGNLEEDMTLSALMRLRRGAWGGSQTSLHSSANSQASNSPHTYTMPRDVVNSPFSIEPTAPMSSSGYSASGSIGIPESEEEDDDEAVASPTITQNSSRRGQKPGPVKQSHMPVLVAHDRPKPHSRNSSGAESVSYVKDPEVPGRFIVERKRMLDSGEIELVGREILLGSI